MSAIASQVSAAIGQTTEQLGQSITYAPLGGSASSPFLAVIDQTESNIGEAGHVMISSTDVRRFLVQASDYSPEPQPGDVIGYDGESFTVMIPDGHQFCWEWSDRFNVRRRVFTKRTN